MAYRWGGGGECEPKDHVEHLGSSSFPPEHRSKSFHACASVCIFDIIVSKGNSCCGSWTSLYVPVLSLTKPTIEMETCLVPSGL